MSGRKCDECGRVSWVFQPSDPATKCEMPQPGGLRCDGWLLNIEPHRNNGHVSEQGSALNGAAKP